MQYRCKDGRVRGPEKGWGLKLLHSYCCEGLVRARLITKHSPGPARGHQGGQKATAPASPVHPLHSVCTTQQSPCPPRITARAQARLFQRKVTSRLPWHKFSRSSPVPPIQPAHEEAQRFKRLRVIIYTVPKHTQSSTAGSTCPRSPRHRGALQHPWWPKLAEGQAGAQHQGIHRFTWRRLAINHTHTTELTEERAGSL